MADFTNIDGVYAKDTVLREGINTLRNEVISRTIKPLTVTKNDTYTAIPSSGTYGYSPIIVDVQEEPWEPLEDGYSNFWFELTNDTLSPWLNFSAKNANAVIDWGDGSGEQSLDTLNPTHTYSKAGRYIVKVKGVTGINPLVYSPFNSAYMSVIYAVEFNNDVVTLANYALQCLTNLEHIKLSDSITSLGTACCRVCSNLADFVTNATLTVIPSNAFNYCVRLKNVNLGNIIETIAGSAFYFCLGLVSITIPASVTSVGSSAFNYCSSLSEVHIQATTPPTLGTNAFQNIASNYVIYVPVGTLSAYQTAWSDYADHIVEEGQSLSKSQLRAIEEEQKKSDNGEEMR